MSPVRAFESQYRHHLGVDHGTHAVSCTATDSAGNSGNNGGPNTVTVNIDSTAPVLTVPVRPVMVNATDPGGALDVIDDEVLHAFAVSGDAPAVAAGLKARLGDVIDRISLYPPHAVNPGAAGRVTAALRTG